MSRVYHNNAQCHINLQNVLGQGRTSLPKDVLGRKNNNMIMTHGGYKVEERAHEAEHDAEREPEQPERACARARHDRECLPTR